MNKKTIAVIFGTRPEAIKLAPVIQALKKAPDIRCQVCVTAQHRQMLDQVLEVFDIKPDIDLNLMKRNQTLAGLTSRAITAVDSYLAREKPDLILVQGDTTTVFTASLAAFYHHIPVGHVEAGLRTGNLKSPWPEELNRVLTTRIATLHFAPTANNRRNLLKEGIPAKNIIVTGNTVIDALFLALAKVKNYPPRIPGLPVSLNLRSEISDLRCPPPPLVLITGHRRENLGDGFENICKAISQLARQFPEVHFVYPVHLNPRVREPVMRILGSAHSSPALRTPHSVLRTSSSLLPNVHLIEPLDYLSFVALMNRSTLILTDSGGVQEEAPSLGKPVIVMRNTTERPEAVKAGTVKVVGTDTRTIVQETTALLTRPTLYKKMSASHNPYGDGKSAARIITACRKFLISP
ncbi:MAG: UDP-N-acetylglucosamine 2-epimerase (non-hydrolyzing) [bacterium]